MKNQVDNLRFQLLRKQETLVLLILATPTGPQREALTEANIHIMAADSALERVLKMEEVSHAR